MLVILIQNSRLFQKHTKNSTVSKVKKMALGSCTCIGLHVFASGQTRNVDLQACTATQMWNQRASVMVNPLVCESTVSPPLLTPPPPPTPLFSGLPPIPPLSPLHRPLPPNSGRSCSIPAGPCLFISSEAAMINEALNTSSLSLGPQEPHS